MNKLLTFVMKAKQKYILKSNCKKQEYWVRIDRINQKWREFVIDSSEKPEEPPSEVVFKSRTKSKICCPNCWTLQHSDRNFCYGYRCNTKFVFEDENYSLTDE